MPPTLSESARLALVALRKPNFQGWVYVEYLTPRIGIERISTALGEQESNVTPNYGFSREQLWKLELLSRVVAAFGEVYPHHVLINWLVGCCPWLDETAPLEFIASSAQGQRTTERQILDAVRRFL